MKNTLYDGYQGPRMSKEMQWQRINRVIQEEMTPVQREVLLAYYIEELNQPEIARRRGVNKSTVCRALKRAEAKLRRYLRY